METDKPASSTDCRRIAEEYSLEWGGKPVFYNCIVGGSIVAHFMPALLKAYEEAAAEEE